MFEAAIELVSKLFRFTGSYLAMQFTGFHGLKVCVQPALARATLDNTMQCYKRFLDTLSWPNAQVSIVRLSAVHLNMLGKTVAHHGPAMVKFA